VIRAAFLLSESFMEDVFKKYYWPGNVRELEIIIESLFIFYESEKIEIEKKNYLGVQLI